MQPGLVVQDCNPRAGKNESSRPVWLLSEFKVSVGVLKTPCFNLSFLKGCVLEKLFTGYNKGLS